MSHRVDLFLFGENVEAEWNRTEGIARFHLGSRSPLKQVTATLLNDLVDQSEADYIGFQQAGIPISAHDLKNAVTRFDDQSNIASVQILHSHSCDPFGIFQSLPASVAILVRAPELVSAVLFRKSILSSGPAFTDVAAPIWDRLIQTVFANDTNIRFEKFDALDDCGETIQIDAQKFPVLAPEVPGRENNWLLDHLQNVQPEELVSPITSVADAVAVKAGLLLIHDYLDESHNLSQSIQGEGRNSAGDYWHAIMHRREPDDSNSKYWFRRVGEQPIFAALAELSETLFQSVTSSESEQWRTRCKTSQGWDPYAFVDFCSYCRRTPESSLVEIAQTIQWSEMLLLLEQSCIDATA